MSEPDPDEAKRVHWPPPIWTSKPKAPAPSVPEPPIHQYVRLSERVTIEHLAELVGTNAHGVMIELVRLEVYFEIHRGVEFDGASRFLRRYGIAATKEP